MALSNPPQGWGQDEITKFLDSVRGNSFATYEQLNPQFQKLIAIDGAYRTLQENLAHTREWFSGFFLLRAHSNLLAAISLASGGQFPESFAVLRSGLESGLYGLYLYRHPELRRPWLERHDSEEHKKIVRNEFKIGSMLDLLRSLDRSEGEVAQKLYDRTIDFGAHPNERALMGSLGIHEDPGNVHFTVNYAGGELIQFKASLKTIAQVGVCVLGMFKLVYRERYDLVGLSDTLRELRVGL